MLPRMRAHHRQEIDAVFTSVGVAEQDKKVNKYVIKSILSQHLNKKNCTNKCALFLETDNCLQCVKHS